MKMMTKRQSMFSPSTTTTVQAQGMPLTSMGFYLRR
jgi:hypothetical protein